MRRSVGRLREAEDSTDVNEMHAALQAVGGRMPAVGGVAVSSMPGPEAREVCKLALEIAKRMSDNPRLKAVANLRRSRDVKEKLQRLWGLMVVESACLAAAAGEDPGAEGAEGRVSRAGYEALHIRIAKVLAEAHRWDKPAAAVLAQKGWAEDSAPTRNPHAA